MKLLILITLLLSLNSYAQHRVEIIKSGEATMQFKEKTLNKAVKRLKKIILSKKRFKGSWSDNQSGYIFDRAKINLDPEATVTEKEYFIPENFSVVVTDITQEVSDVEADELVEKNDRKEVKDLIDTVENKKIRRILKRMTKDIYGKN